MYLKINVYQWFMLSCTPLGESQHPSLTTWNICQLFPPCSGNSFLLSSTGVHFGSLQFPCPCLWVCQLAGLICWRSHRLFVFADNSSVRYLSSYGFLHFFHRTGKAKSTVERRWHKSENILLPFYVLMLNSKKLKIQKETFLPWEGRQKAPHGLYFFTVK